MKITAKEAAEIVGVKELSSVYRFLRRHNVKGEKSTRRDRPQLFELSEVAAAGACAARTITGLPKGLRTSNPQLYKRLWHELRGTRSKSYGKRKTVFKCSAREREQARAYHHRNHTKVALSCARTACRGRPNTFSLADWKRRLAETGGRCAYCGRNRGNGKRKSMQLEHIVAISRGGWNTYANVVPSCQPCNAKKSNRCISPFDMDIDGTTHFGPIHTAGIADPKKLEKMLNQSLTSAEGIV